MKSYILLIFLYIVLGTSVLAQTSREVYPEQVQIQHNEAVKNFSSDYISAFQNSPHSTSSLEGITGDIYVRGMENFNFLLQEGYDIQGVLDITGNNNKTNSQQRGSNLHSALNITGDDNQFDMLQQGNNLQNQLQLYGSGARVSAVQTDLGMNIRQRGPGVIPMDIQHTGRTAPIIIQNN